MRSAGRRIVLVEFSPSGGLYHFGIQLGEALARRGHSVEVLTGPDPEVFSRESGCVVMPVLPTWHPAAGRDASEIWRRCRRIFRAGRLGAAWIVLAAHCRRTRPDVVMWSVWRFAMDGIMVTAMRWLLPNTVFALVAHEPRPLVEQPGQAGLYKRGKLTRRTHQAAYDALDIVYVLGESARDVVLSEWRPVNPVVIIPHGNEDLFGGRDVRPASNTPPRVLFFGTIAAYKGLDLLFEAWPTVRWACPEATLVVTGKINADVDRASVEEKCARLEGVDLRIGYVDMDDVPGLFDGARVVALPYVRGTQSGVASLAHTFSRPVVSTRVGSIPEVVRDEETGLLCEPGDADQLAAALIRLLQEPALAEELGRGGRRRLDQEASWDTVAERVDETLPLRMGAS